MTKINNNIVRQFQDLCDHLKKNKQIILTQKNLMIIIIQKIKIKIKSTRMLI